MAKKLSIDRSRGESPRLEHRRATSIRETLLERFFLQRHSSEDTGPGSAAPPCHHPARRPCAALALMLFWERASRDQSPTPGPQGGGAARSTARGRSRQPLPDREGVFITACMAGKKFAMPDVIKMEKTCPLHTGARWPMPWPSCTGIKRG